jgi:hypothetical protein
MKNFIKRFMSVALVAMISFSVFGCILEVDNDYGSLNGDWERPGQYVVTFNNGNGSFKECLGGIWLEAKNANQIKIGEQCYRNFVKDGDKKWKGEIRIYNSFSPHQTLYWEECTLALNSNGQTLTVDGSWTLTKK